MIRQTSAWGRLVIMSVGLIVYRFFDHSIDYVLYPFVIWKLGVLRGGVAMMFISFAIDLSTMKIYDILKKDWLGIETAKEIKEYLKNRSGSIVGRLFTWADRSDLLMIIVLTLKFNPFIVTAYMRHGAHEYNGLNKKDWNTFMTSLVAGNAYWVLTIFIGVSVVKYFVSLF